jgi:hypothetical protein
VGAAARGAIGRGRRRERERSVGARGRERRLGEREVVSAGERSEGEVAS